MRSISDIRRKAHYELDLLRYASEKRRVDGHGIPKALPHQFGICVIVKNEGRYIAEWLRYHQVAGVDVVYLYDNGSTDDTAERIRPFVESGFVEYTIFPGAGRQLDAYNDCLRRHRWGCKYIAFIDADEFLFKMDRDADLVSIVDSIMALDPEAGGVAVNWRMFGSSGLEHMPTRGACSTASSGGRARIWRVTGASSRSWTRAGLSSSTTYTTRSTSSPTTPSARPASAWTGGSTATTT